MSCGSGACGSGATCGSGGGCSTGSCGSGGCGSRGTSGRALRDVVGVRFNSTAKTHYCDSTGLDLTRDDPVIVETENGEEFATVVQATGPSRKFAGAPLKKILRAATPRDVAWNAQNRRREEDAFRFCVGQVRQRRLEMKLVYAEESFDRKKLTFYFTAEGRVDFRDLVKELAGQFRSRIEMRQIGPRDEAKVVGGYGICGRPLCCTTFLKEFSPVSIKMAKRQGLSLNPSKISGRCGRLMCCLKYEDTGEDLSGRQRRPGPPSPPPAA